MQTVQPKETGICQELPLGQNPEVPRSPYLFLLAVFTISRAVYYLLGVRFDAEGLGWYFQFLDPELLRHRLAQSLFYLHMQPPGHNLFAGVLLKLFPHAYAAAFHAVHLVCGAAVTCLLFYCMRSLGVRVRLALAATALFMVSPGVVLFENFILYEYQMMFFMTVSAALLFHYSAHRRAISAVGFLACQFWLVMLRNQYHLVYFAFIFAVLLYFAAKPERRAVAAAGSVFCALILALYLKNQILFGQFVSSTYLGMNISALTTFHLTPGEKQAFVAEGKISRASAETCIGSPLSYFYPYIVMPPKTSIPALDQEVKPSGVVNLNHKGFLEVQKIYSKDALFVLRHYPIAYLRGIAVSWFTYFLPAGDLRDLVQNRSHIEGIERFFDIVFCGQFKYMQDKKELRRLKAGGKALSLLLYTGIFLLIAFPALFVFGIRVLWHGIRRKTLDAPQALTLGFLLFNIFYLTAVSNFFGCFENNRYRFPLDGFFVVLAALALEQAWRRLKRQPG
ncbi:MAG: phospholipid carrier-dependent glycosyltransferase [Chitinispirillaceae bacterium]|nr:phospholipid carrier-dependent glycosyltransferase [Chitinispirillaceae bacterium]